MRTVRVTHEFNGFLILDLEHLLESLADLLQHGLAFFDAASLLAWCALARRSRPQSDTVEALANVDDNAHDFVVALVFELLANGG